MHDDQVDVSVDQLRDLLRAQRPAWADLAIEPVPSSGTDHTIYRLGDDLVVRLPLIEWAMAQADLEAEWLPRLAPLLPFALHEPAFVGEPAAGYPWRWCVYRWIDGEDAHPSRITDRVALAHDVAALIRALRAVDAPDVPRSGRGRPLRASDTDMRGAIESLRSELDADAVLAAWDAALAAPKWDGPWAVSHGDLTDGNLLLRGGRLHAVIDWSLFGLGDPALDLAVAWDVFDAEARGVFRDQLDVDDATWARARGWAITAVYGIPYYRETNPGIVERSWRRLANVIEEYAGS
jgi:aminoglycoside phosphotransferase (APT) family kinase protein